MLILIEVNGDILYKSLFWSLKSIYSYETNYTVPSLVIIVSGEY